MSDGKGASITVAGGIGVRARVSAGLAQAYGEGGVEAMWAARDAQVPMGHMGEAWDVAYAALFLASDEARYVTGLDMVVDGGITLKYG